MSEEKECLARYQAYIEEKRLMLWYDSEKEKKFIKRNLVDLLDRLFEEVIKLQRIGDIATLGWVSLMFLRDSIRTNEYDFRIDLYDDESALIKEGPIFCWNPDFIFFQMEKDIKGYLESIGEKTDMLSVEMKERYISPYFSVAEQISREVVPEILALATYDKLKKSDELKMSFEHFKGQRPPLYSRKEDLKARGEYLSEDIAK